MLLGQWGRQPNLAILKTVAAGRLTKTLSPASFSLEVKTFPDPEGITKGSQCVEDHWKGRPNAPGTPEVCHKIRRKPS
jgi:hypothetical protein